VETEGLARLGELVLVPVIEIPDPELVSPLADALVEGGLPCAEITFRTEAAATALASMVRLRPDMLVGAGTVLSVDQVDRALDAGAKFLVSPGFNPNVVEYALGKGAVVLPGICTPSEIEMARMLGLDTVKFFPAEAAGGAKYIKALTAPYRSLRFVPTGGIDANNLEGYLSIPQVLAVGGSWMAPKRLLQERKFAEIAQRTREAVTLARRLRPAVAGDGAAGGGGVLVGGAR
jgi:2-dehydro-3-deoxyphosphogluconate aldolase/(4S)-4-hydroxy-2-oxoglutarate aldolase